MKYCCRTKLTSLYQKFCPMMYIYGFGTLSTLNFLSTVKWLLSYKNHFKTIFWTYFRFLNSKINWSNDVVTKCGFLSLHPENFAVFPLSVEKLWQFCQSRSVKSLYKCRKLRQNWKNAHNVRCYWDKPTSLYGTGKGFSDALDHS